jgi:hypothetical protein
MKLIKMLLALNLVLMGSSAFGQISKLYTGTLIDAHSQVRCDIDPIEVGQLIESANVDYVLLSASGCNKREKFFSDMVTQHENLASVVSKHDKSFGLAGMKNLNGDGRWHPEALIKAVDIGDKADFKGVAEILIQHAVWDGGDARLRTDGVQLKITDKEFLDAVRFIKKRDVPVIIHIEFNDSADKREKTIEELKSLLTEFPDQPFALIHIGQASPEIASNLLSSHKNIYFLTSMTSGFNQIVTRGKQVHHQSGWETFYEVSGKNMKQHVSNPEWRPVWRDLVLAYPNNFVLAFDNVFAGNWRNRLPRDILIWRRGLDQLPPDIANKVACDNAKRLWKLPVDCK